MTKMICLLSGGIDSPVAAYMMMRKGVEVILVHFQNETQLTSSVKDKVVRLAKVLLKHQKTIKLYIVPFGEIQRQIIMSVDSRIRMLVYRRMMMRIACELAKKEKAKALITGDSLGQVASQTMANLNCVYEASPLPIVAPLIGFDKLEIIKIARRIGTYELSILPYQDCCSMFVAEHPKTKSDVAELKKAEKPLKVRALVYSAIKQTVVSQI